jgi:DNA-binding MarR family transcriptional regulator
MPDEDANTPDELAAELLSVLGRLYRQIRRTGALGDLTLAEMSALGRLRRFGPITASELAKLEQISPQSIGTTVAALEARGLVTGTPDQTDGRRTMLSLTAAGEETALAKRSFRAQQLTAAVGGLSPRERSELSRALPLLERIGEALE